ncbi:hypothetical protein GTA08_BOTSDO10928 [Botryosphaeria dothidea]|uniref:Uncharacterized protein n=1 Tax=Botryosphaeria dothidea TaxID=55169 RepID=A0A8H4IL25_9PEZI|nr:hypothetical protein GTA08_BOTSDO10928 [Botryosphaeria dothidea]
MDKFDQDIDSTIKYRIESWYKVRVSPNTRGEMAAILKHKANGETSYIVGDPLDTTFDIENELEGKCAGIFQLDYTGTEDNEQGDSHNDEAEGRKAQDDSESSVNCHLLFQEKGFRSFLREGKNNETSFWSSPSISHFTIFRDMTNILTLESEVLEIQKKSFVHLTEYACDFWMSHFLEIDPEVLEKEDVVAIEDDEFQFDDFEDVTSEERITHTSEVLQHEIPVWQAGFKLFQKAVEATEVLNFANKARKFISDGSIDNKVLNKITESLESKDVYDEMVKLVQDMTPEEWTYWLSSNTESFNKSEFQNAATALGYDRQEVHLKLYEEAIAKMDQVSWDRSGLLRQTLATYLYRVMKAERLILESLADMIMEDFRSSPNPSDKMEMICQIKSLAYPGPTVFEDFNADVSHTAVATALMMMQGRRDTEWENFWKRDEVLDVL